MKRHLLLALAGSLALGGTAAADVNQTIEIIDRPLTLPDRTLELGFSIGFVRFDGGPMGEGRTNTGVGLGLGYGFSPDFEGRIGYGFSLDPSSGKGPLSVGVAYSLVSVGAFSAAADLFTGFHVADEELLPLGIGVEARLKLGAKLALLTPGHQLTFELHGDNSIYLDLPIGLGFQASRNIFLQVQTNIARIAIKDSSSGVFGADFIPITLEAFYSLTNAVDFGVSFQDDLDRPADTYAIIFLARLFF